VGVKETHQERGERHRRVAIRKKTTNTAIAIGGLRQGTKADVGTPAHRHLHAVFTRSGIEAGRLQARRNTIATPANDTRPPVRESHIENLTIVTLARLKGTDQNRKFRNTHLEILKSQNHATTGSDQ
jgi:hypothetical protein